MTRVYYREAVGALVVFDMTRLSTFQAVLKWKGDLDSKVHLMKEGRKVILIGTVFFNKFIADKSYHCYMFSKGPRGSRKIEVIRAKQCVQKDRFNTKYAKP